MSVTSSQSAPVFDHLLSLTHGPALFEHALLATARPEHGYCVDDVARALVVVCREPSPSPAVRSLERRFLDFTLWAVQPDGRCHNRMPVSGGWSDQPALGDWWGRALWGLGVASARAATPQSRLRALHGFVRAARGRPSPHLRASVFAALGAAEVLAQYPDERCARDLLIGAVAAIGTAPAPVVPSWPWPEQRLTYANGSVVEALLVAGAALPDAAALRHGLELLDFLLTVESGEGHLSVTPVGGRGPAESGPAFDQQPIEVAALADACATAFDLTGAARWRDAVAMAWAWFAGSNDAGIPMVDPLTGAGFDGLHAHGRNLNQGAESTVAAISTWQQAKRLGVLR